MSHPSAEEFEREALAQGYEQVLVRDWAPHTIVADHTHPFDASAVVTAGEMWLTVGGNTRHLLPGDRFQLERNVPHAERYGDAGATYWVARRT